MLHPPTGRTLRVVVVPRSWARPHAIRRAGEGIEADQIWIRRGPGCAIANRTDLEEMVRHQVAKTIVNLSTHLLSEKQVEQIRLYLNCRISRVIHQRVEFNHDESFSTQAHRLVEDLRLPVEAWSERSAVLILPGLSAAAAAVLADIHGRCGGFPGIIRLKPVSSGGTTTFELAEVLDLQEVRERARRTRP